MDSLAGRFPCFPLEVRFIFGWVGGGGGELKKRMPATTICFANIKGGVGKTTLATNVAHVLSTRRETRVLLVDMDPQINATTALLPFSKAQNFRTTHHSVRNFFDPVGEVVKADPEAGVDGNEFSTLAQIEPREVGRAPTNKGFDLVLGSMDLALLELNGSGNAAVAGKLREGLVAIGAYDDYDYIVIDTPPTPSINLRAGLSAADYFVSPSRGDFLSVQGLALFHRIYDILGFTDDAVPLTAKPLGVILSMEGEQNLEKGQKLFTKAMAKVERLPEFFDPFRNGLRYYRSISSGQAKQRLILELGLPANSAKREIRRISNELLSRISRARKEADHG